MEILVNKDLFATYLGLTASGYSLVIENIEKDDRKLGELIKNISELALPAHAQDYLLWARTDSCEANPYWPRGAVLATACFFLKDRRLERQPLKAFLISCGNLTVDGPLLNWAEGLPGILEAIMEIPEFPALWAAYRRLLQERELLYSVPAAQVDRALQLFFPSGRLCERLAFAPNLLQAPADYVCRDGRLIVIAPFPRVDTMLHEYLHPVVARCHGTMLPICRERGFSHLYDQERMAALGYLAGGGEAAHLHVVEECFVRGLSLYLTKAVAGEGDAISRWNGDNGFWLAERVYEEALAKRPVHHELREFARQVLSRCQK